MFMEEVRETKEDILRDIKRIETELMQIKILIQECRDRNYAKQVETVLVATKIMKTERLNTLKFKC